MTITKEQVIDELKEIKDPELGIDIWTLGLIYDIKIDDEGIEITMTLTTPFCPFADELILQAEKRTKTLLKDESQSVRVELTFDPPWKPSEELRAMLGV